MLEKKGNIIDVKSDSKQTIVLESKERTIYGFDETP